MSRQPERRLPVLYGVKGFGENEIIFPWRFDSAAHRKTKETQMKMKNGKNFPAGSGAAGHGKAVQDDAARQRERTKAEREKAVRWLLSHEREQRWIIALSCEWAEYEKSAEWIKSEEARNYQKFWDFVTFFERLKKMMAEFRWSKEFLQENGIDFVKAKKLYFSVC